MGQGGHEMLIWNSEIMGRKWAGPEMEPEQAIWRVIWLLSGHPPSTTICITSMAKGHSFAYFLP